MVITKAINKRDRLITSSLHYYYSINFLRVKIKDQTYSKLHIEGNIMRTKIAEWRPPSFKSKQINKNQRHTLVACCLKFNSLRQLSINMPHLKHWKSLQNSNKYLDSIGDPQKQRARRSYLFSLMKTLQAVHCSSISRKGNVLVNHTPCKNNCYRG